MMHHSPAEVEFHTTKMTKWNGRPTAQHLAQSVVRSEPEETIFKTQGDPSHPLRPPYFS
jgi:hypothetical protein